jgi:transglutaminase-like putative cysteine protease
LKIHIEHETIFTYTQPVREAIGEARLHPRHDAGQQVHSFQLVLDPSTPFDVIADRFGNSIHCYSMLSSHQRMVVTATSVLSTSTASLSAAPPLTLMERHDFTAPSPYVPISGDLLAFAQHHASNGGTAEDTAHALMGAIYETCAYEPGSTTSSTAADAVLVGRRGVCQDFAHLLIALSRSLGLPARYVSGYLYDPDKSPDAILASHAWVEVFLDGRGWLGLDPTHNRVVGVLYARIAIGRDYTDAAPVRGVYQNSAQETLAVRVRMRAGSR